VDASVRDRHDAREDLRCVVADVAPLIRGSRSKPIRRHSFACSFCFAHGPPVTRLHVGSHARRNRHALGVIHQA